MFDKDCVGDVSAVRALIPNLTSNGDNWVKGTKGKFKICAKVFAEGSSYGIKGGRISKIQVCDVSQPDWGFEGCYINYDRGWDIRASDPEAVEFINELLSAFGDEELDDDDLTWWDLYGYESQAAFDKYERDFLGSIDRKQDALEEAQGYLDHPECNYAIMKVISRDSEEEEIIRKDAA